MYGRLRLRFSPPFSETAVGGKKYRGIRIDSSNRRRGAMLGAILGATLGATLCAIRSVDGDASDDDDDDMCGRKTCVNRPQTFVRTRGTSTAIRSGASGGQWLAMLRAAERGAQMSMPPAAWASRAMSAMCSSHPRGTPSTITTCT